MYKYYTENEKEIYLAMLAEQCERYKDMIEILENLINKKKEEINSEEKNLISIAYKNYISEIRNSINIIISYENKELLKEKSFYLDYIKEYKEKIIKELEIECIKICNSIENIIKPKLETKELKVFFGKLKGDYYRYIAENTEGEIKNKYSNLSLNTYKESLIEAENLNYKNSNKLGLLLNLSVFYYEVNFNFNEELNLAKDTLNKVKNALNGLDEDNEEFKDSISILNLLNDNIKLWEMENEK